MSCAGVRTYNLKKRLLAWNEVKAEMCFRKLNMSRAPEAGYVQKLIEFVEKVDGLEYNLSVMDIVSRKSIAVEKRKAFFCSELVAAAYKHVGVIFSDRPANSYFPGSLASDQDASLGLIDGVTLAPEVDLVFRHPEVADAARRDARRVQVANRARSPVRRCAEHAACTARRAVSEARRSLHV